MGIGIWQILIILLIVLVLFGAGKLPTIMGDFAKGIKSFKRGLSGDDDEEEPAKAIDPPTEAVLRTDIHADRMKS